MIKTTTAKGNNLPRHPVVPLRPIYFLKFGKIGTFPKFQETKVFIVWQFLRSAGIKKSHYHNVIQWHLNLIYSGGSRGGALGSQTPTFLTKPRPERPKKNFETEPPLSQNLDDCQSATHPPLFWRSGSATDLI